MTSTRSGHTRPRANESRVTSTPRADPQRAPISASQSTDTVQMLLHASISSLAWVRSLFSDKYFETRVFDQKAPLQTYGDYLNAPSIEHDLQRSSKRTGTPMRHLCRGKGGTADRFLDQLELGVFDAIRKGCLKALQLRIFEDEKRPECVLETYTFTIEYASHKEGAVLATIDVERQGSEGYTISVVKKGYTTFMRALLDYTNNLPHLPDVRFLDTYLFFNERCNQTYQAPGFESAIPDHLVFPRTSDWTVATQDIRGFKTGHHSVDFVLSHLISVAPNEASFDQIPPGLPHSLRYPAWVDILTTKETESMEIDLDDVTPRRSLQTEELLGKTPLEATRRMPIVLADISPLAIRSESSHSSQLIRDLAMRDRLRRMQQPETQPSGLVATQLRRDTPPAAQEEHELEQEQVQQEAKQTGHKRLRYSQAVIKRIWGRKSRRVASRSARKKDRNVIRCSCNQNLDEDQMIMCDQCDTWQHAECHGYLSTTDQRIPDFHLCYSCLLRGHESELLKEMEALAFERRAVDTVRAVGWHGNEDFSQRLGCSLEAATKLTDQLRRKGYLLDRPSKKRRCLQNPRAVINPAHAIQDKFIAEYYNPSRAIEHHLNLPTTLLEEYPKKTGHGRSSSHKADAASHLYQTVANDQNSGSHLLVANIPHSQSRDQQNPTAKSRQPNHITNERTVFVTQEAPICEIRGDAPRRDITLKLSKHVVNGNSEQSLAVTRVTETPFVDDAGAAPRGKRQLPLGDKGGPDRTTPRKRMRASRVKNYLRVTMSS